MLADKNLRLWRAATRAAISATHVADHANAARHYLAAANEAEQLLLHRCEDLPTARIYVSSWHNLVESYRCLGRDDLALAAARQAHDRLMSLIGDSLLPYYFRLECIQELTRSLLPLIDILQHTSESPQEVRRLVQQAKQITEQTLRECPKTAPVQRTMQ